MQPISVRTTSNKFIVSIDRKWIDNEAQCQETRYEIAKRFKSSAASTSITSKYDVYEQ